MTGNDITPPKVVTPFTVSLTRYVDGDLIVIGTADITHTPEGGTVTAHPWDRYAHLATPRDEFSINYDVRNWTPREVTVIPPQNVVTVNIGGPPTPVDKPVDDDHHCATCTCADTKCREQDWCRRTWRHRGACSVIRDEEFQRR